MRIFKLNNQRVTSIIALAFSVFLIPQHSHAGGCVTLPAGAVGWWSADGTPSDEFGLNNGVINGGASYAAGKVGQAFVFNGTNSYVEISDSQLLSPQVTTTGELTLEAWVNFSRLPQFDTATSSPYRSIAVKGSSGQWEYGLFMSTNAEVYFNVWQANGNSYAGTSSSAISANQWHHLAGVLSSGNFLRLYIDGQMVGEKTSFSGGLTDGTSSLFIGRRGDGQYFDGMVDEVTLYARALSGDEVKSIYDAGSNGKCLSITGGKVPYFANFESGVGSEWIDPSLNASATFAFTRFLGRYGNNGTMLMLTNLTVGTSYTLGFDFYAIDSWDGTPSDYFNVSLNGSQVFHQTFANYNNNPQTFSGSPDEGRDNFGFNSSYLDAIYRNIEVTFTASNSLAVIGFSGQGLQELDDESWGIDNVSVRLSSDLKSAFIRSSSLPGSGTTNAVAIDRFTISANWPLTSAAATGTTNYSLKMPGADGVFGTSDDLVIPITASSPGNGGHSVLFTIANTPLQPGRYQFIANDLQCTNGLAVANYTNVFTIANPVSGVVESTSDDTLDAATTISLAESPAGSGLFSAAGVGIYRTTGDVDYWRFDAEAGDVVTVRIEAETPGTYPQLYLQNSSGSTLWSGRGDYSGVVQFQNYTISSPGTYYLRTWSDNRYSLYWSEIIVTRQPNAPQVESEGNDSQNAANLLVLNASPGLYQTRVAGLLPSADSNGDYFSLGNLNGGNTLNLGLLFPAGTTLSNQTYLSVQAAGSSTILAGSYQGSLSYTFPSNGIYYVHVETTNRNIRALYLLSVAVSDVVPPQVVATSLPAEGNVTDALINAFTLSFSEDMQPAGISNSANYILRCAGADGVFGTADDLFYTVVSTGYTSGLSSSYQVSDGPLQPGSYRFTLSTNVSDRAANNMSSPFVRNFSIINLSGYVLENRSNDIPGLGTQLSLSVTTNADGTISPWQTLGSLNYPRFVAAGQFNGDTNLDVVSANWGSGNITLFTNTGNGVMQVLTNVNTGDAPVSIAVGDFNKDGNADLAVANYNAGTVTILLQKPAGVFQVLTNITGFSNPYNLAVADLNADGVLDLVVPNSGNSTVRVLLGNGDGTFTLQSNYNVGSYPQTVAIGDVNKDGKPDFVVANYYSATVSILTNMGSGSFAVATNLPVGPNPRYVGLEDLSGDGKLDLIVLQPGNNTVAIIPGNGDGTFGDRRSYLTRTTDAYQFQLADLNGDGRKDLVIGGYGNSTLSFLYNSGSGVFTNVLTMSGYYPMSVALGDFNKDGVLDLAFASYYGGYVSIWAGNTVNPIAENPSGSGLKTISARGIRSSSSDVDYYRFYGTSGDQAVLAVETPGHPSGSSLRYAIQTTDGTELTAFTVDYSGWGQSGVVTLPYTGTYLIRVSSNYDYQGEYRFRLTLTHPPMQLESEGNDGINSADLVSLSLTNGHLKGSIAGYLSYGDGGDVYGLGYLLGGSSISLGVREPSNSGLAEILSVYNSAGTLMTNSSAAVTNFAYTIPSGADGNYYIQVTAGSAGAFSTPDNGVSLYSSSDSISLGKWFNNQVFTISMWVNPSASQNSYANILDNNHSSTVSWTIEQAAGTNNSYIWGDGMTGVPFTLTPNTWQQLVITRDSTNINRVYVNGTLVGMAASSGQINYDGSQSLLIGDWVKGSRNWSGMLNELRIWNKPLTPTEITASMTGTLSGKETGLIGYWPLNEGYGTNSADLTASNHVATFANGVGWAFLGSSNATSPSLLAQYILDVDLANSTAPQITSVSLPAGGSTVSNIVTSFAVGFSEDMDPIFTRLVNTIYRYNGHTYLITPSSMSWYDAESTAISLGGHLVAINDADENNWVAQIFSGTYGDIWIGANDIAKGIESFTWTSGDLFSYSNWNGGEPSNSGGTEWVGEMYSNSSHTWNDINPGNSRYGVIEISDTKDTDGDGWVDVLDPYPSDALNVFDLRTPGADGVFDTADDVKYQISCGDYSRGLSATFNVIDGPLQPGVYRFKVTTSLKDRFGNALATPYVRYFTNIAVNGFVEQNRRTNGVSTTSLSLAQGSLGDASFSLNSSLSLGNNPYFVNSGDFNKDGHLDLVFANFGDHTVSVATNDSTGHFSISTNITLDSGTISIGVGDFDADSKLDLAVANYYAGTVSILKGNGAGGFTLFTNISGFSYPRNLEVADFNKDGILDFAVPNENNSSVSILFGAGGGSFTNATKYTVGSSPETVRSGDLNGDGYLDLVVPNSGSATFSVLMGSSDGSFTLTTNYSTVSTPRYAALADVNGDGKLDVVLVNNGNQLSVYPGNGDGSFGTRTDYNISSGDTYQVLLADLNGDGKLDVVVPAYGASRLMTLLNNGDGTFGSQINYNPGNYPISAVVGDFNKDGRLDIVTANYYGANSWILFGNNRQTLALDTAGTGLRLAAGRGNIADSSDYDYWTFSAATGDRLLIGTEAPGDPYGSSLLYRIYYPDGGQWTYFYSDGYGRGDASLTIPASGTYTIRVERSQNYSGEYRFRVTLATPPAQLESEDNSSIANADVLTYTQTNGQRIASVGGYIGNADGNGDYYQLGNLGVGTQITLNWARPSASHLEPILEIYNSSGVLVTNTRPDQTNLVFMVDAGLGGAYYAHVDSTLASRKAGVTNALYFNASSTYINIGNWSPGTQWSMQAWVMPTDLPSGRRTVVGGVGGCRDWAIVLNGGYFAADVGLNGCVTYYTSPTAASTYTWYHLAISCDGTNAYFYVNGQMIASGPVDLNFAPYPGGTWIGGESCCGGYFPGIIQDVSIWSRPLSGAEVNAFMANSPVGTESGLAGLWSLQDGNGTTVPDLSGNGHTGTLVNGLYWMTLSSTNSLTSGLFQQYLLNVRLMNTIAPAVVDVNLPAEGAVSSNIWDRFTVTFSEDMSPASVTNSNNYDLRGAGPDGTFGTADDQIYTVINSPAYASGNSATFYAPDGPIQPGLVRFTVKESVTDPLGTTMNAPYVRNFSVVNVPGFTYENRGDNSIGKATSLSSVRTNRADGAFTAGADKTMGTGVERLAVGKIDGDSNLDIIAALWGYGGVGVLLGNGDGTFTVKTNYLTGSQAWSVALGKFNADTNLDVAVANYGSGTISILLGNGDGTFKAGSNYNVGSNPYHVVVADLNGDGKQDLIVPNRGSGKVSILLGNGDGTFQTKTDYTVGSAPSYVAVADINGDGKLDLFVANYNDNNVSLLLGKGDGTFASPIEIAAGTSPRSLAVGDVNADGKLDLLVFNGGDNNVSVYLGNGDGSFASRVNYIAGTYDGYDMLLQDVNGDGLPDIVIPGYNNSTLNLLFNAGGGKFASPASYPIGYYPVGIVCGDFNNDGRLDFVLGNDYGNSISILYGNDTQLLSTDSMTGLRIGAGRGNLYDSSQADYWSFDAQQNDVFALATEVPGNPSGSGLYFTIYRPDGRTLTSFSADYYGRGQASATCPLTGTYTVRVSPNYNYFGEYRIRVTLASPPIQAESEGNDSAYYANTLSYTVTNNHQKATVLGYYSSADGGDFFKLGTLVSGSSINLSLTQPGSSGLVGGMSITDPAGNTLAYSKERGTNLTFTVSTNGDYYVDVWGDTTAASTLALGGTNGYALRFWGGDWISFTNAEIPSSGDFTVECWAYATASSGYREIISQGTGGNAFYLGTDGSRIRSGDSWQNTGVSYPFYGWHHFAIVKSSSSTLLYVDGALAATLGSAIANPVMGEGFRIGRQYGGYSEQWLGYIDDVRVWNVARSAADISSNFTNRLSGAESGLVGYWRFDEGSGYTIHDSTSAGATGTFNGTLVWVPFMTNAQTPNIFAQYLLGIDVNNATPLTVLSNNLPVASTTNGNIIDRFTVYFPIDLNTSINGINRDIRLYNGRAYTVTSGTCSWYDAETQARALGGHLVAINDAAENEWLVNTFGSYGYFWIGLNDESKENTWTWSSGDALVYSNWDNGQPGGTTYDYAFLRNDNSKWSTRQVNYSSYYGVIEITGTDTDGDGIPDSLDPYPNDPYNGFDLRTAGKDGLFDTSDDEIYHIAINNYSTGESLSASVTDGPLQPGYYRFTVTKSLKDVFGNSLSTPYVQYFTVTNLAGYVLESRTNNTAATATPLAWNEELTGFKTVAARGNMSTSSDNDYYSFSGAAGDVFNIASYTIGSPSGSELHYQVFKTNGTRIVDFYPSYYGNGESSSVTLPESGTYTISVSSYYDYQGEYRFRITTGTPPLQMETEANDTIANANSLNFTSDTNGRSVSVIGRIRIASDLDYYNLGTVTNGSSIILNVRQPATSGLVPVVSVYNASGVYQSEIYGGRSSDGVANVPITTTGVYYALVRGTGDSGDMDDQYVLDVNIVPTGSVNYPNLVVSDITPPSGSGILSGQKVAYTFTVANIGSVATASSAWMDRAVFSQDATLGNGDDIAVGFFSHSGILNSGASYTVTNLFTLPDGISGDFYVIVQTDSGSAVNEYMFDGDNTTVSTTTFHVSLAPYPDLTIENLNISNPTNSAYTITWNVANRGNGTAPGGFYGRYIVSDKISGVVLTNEETVVTNTLATNAVVSFVRTFSATNSGTYLVQVIADSRDTVYEYNSYGHAAAETNNTATATFQIMAYYNVALQSNPTNAGVLSGAGKFGSGTAVTVTATPATNTLPYIFVNWTEGGSFQSAGTNYTFIISRDRSLTANFTLPTYLVSASVTPAGAGIVSGQGSFMYGTTNVLTASANYGYRFSNWTENGTVISQNASLTNVVLTNRTFIANFAEANVTHIVTTMTSPTNVTTVAGAGTYNNGQSAVISAPALVTNPPTIYKFKEFQLSGTVVSSSPSFTKTFSTLDSTNLTYVAVYDSVSILPVITNVTVNYSGTIPATTNAILTFRFDRSMNTNVTPVILITNAFASKQPQTPAGGTWSKTVLSNDTFALPPVTFSTGMDGTNTVWVSNARDISGGILTATNLMKLIVDATPPVNPVLSLTASNNASATVSWSSYVAPSDLNGFRIFISTNSFTSVTGLVPVSAVATSTRSYTYSGLLLDKTYYAAVVAIDTAGNSSPAANVFAFKLTSTLPPPVTVKVSPVGASSALVSWSDYDTSSLIGFAGFNVYYETNNFSSVAGRTIRQTLASDARTVQVDNLDRTRTYYFAVIGYNVNNASNPAVTTVTWSDPYAGKITANMTITGAVDILQSITVTNNAVLTIAAGSTLRFAAGTGLTVEQGALIANGTALDPVVFTSSNDRQGATPNAGDWNGITLKSGAGASVLRNAFVQFGAGLNIANCSPTVDAFTAVNNSSAGLSLGGSATLVATNALIYGNTVGIQQLGAAVLSVSNSVVKNNSTNALATGGLILHANQVWWGTANGTEIDGLLSGAVDRSNFLTGEPLLTPAIGTSNNVTQVGSQSVNLRLACRTADTMRLSEDSTFANVFFNTFTNQSTFALSAGGGLKTVFAQFRSVTGQTSAPVAVSVTYITTGPSISSFNLYEGAILTRPGLIVASASAPLGMAAMEFYVDDAGYATNAGGSLSYWFDIRNLSVDTHRIHLIARDNSGNIASRLLNVVISPTPPPTPYITTPVQDMVINSNKVVVAGSAEPYITVQLINSGKVIGATNASADGTFTFPTSTLDEGLNQIVVQATDALGAARSATRSITVDTMAPAKLIMDTPVYQPNVGLTVSWHFPTTGKHATSFQVYWSKAPITNTASALGHTIAYTSTSTTLQGLGTATYYFYVVGYDSFGNSSPLSDPVVFAYDAMPPSFTIGFDKSSPVGVSVLHVILTSSESLLAKPTLTVQPYGSTPSMMSLSNSALNTYEGDINVTPLLPSGLMTFRVSASDLSSNVFNGVPNGPAMVIDVTPPTGVVSIAEVPPIQTTNTTNIVVSLQLSEAPKPGTLPALAFGPPTGDTVGITMSGTDTNWSGLLTLTSAMGTGIGHFTLSVTDSLDNVGHSITSGSSLEIYNTALPSAPAQPVNFHDTTLSGGRIALSWDAVPNAEIYRVYCETGMTFTVPTTLVADNITVNRATNTPPVDGYYRYVVTASRRGAEGVPSIVRVAYSDRTPPATPTGLAVKSVAKGLQITWNLNTNDVPDHYNLYRNGTLIYSTSGGTSFIDYPPRGTMSYVIAAADSLGNEAQSAPVTFQLLVGAVDNFQVLVSSGQPSVLSWISTDSTAVGFNIYRNGVKQNATPLSSSTYSDSLALGNEAVTYSVTALNSTNGESIARQVTVHTIALGLLVNSTNNLTTGFPISSYFDKYSVSISNLTDDAVFPLSQIELYRTVAGASSLNRVVPMATSILSNSVLTTNMALPSVSASGQSVRIRAVQQTDSVGSTVIYENTFALADVQSSGVTMNIQPNDLPLAGGYASFTLTVFNRSQIPIYIATTRNSGASAGDLYIAIKNSQGQEVSRTTYNGVPTGVIFADGVGYIGIPANSSTNLMVTNVLVPEALASNVVTFQAVFSAIYDRRDATGQQTSGPLYASIQSSLTQTPYYGTAQTDRALYSGDTPIVITGKAVDRVTSKPVSNADLKIGFSARGSVWYVPVTTDSSGNYSYSYTPTPGFAGALSLWAAHPLVYDALNQASVRIYRIYLTPSTGTIRMSQNDNLPFSISIYNPGDVDLTGFTLSSSAYQMDGTNEIPITTLTGTLLSDSSLVAKAGQLTAVQLKLAAAANAPTNAVVEFTLTSAEGASGTFVATVALSAAVPVLTVTQPDVGYVEVSLDRGSLLSRQVTVVNNGLKILQGVKIHPPTNSTWMTINLARSSDGTISLPDIDVGQSNVFTVVFVPTTNIDLGYYKDKLTITGTNSTAIFDVNLFARVTSANKGDVQFYVDDILGLDVPNATVRLRNVDLGVELPAVQTDINGLVTVTNLQEGQWSWQVNAAGHSANVGVVTIVPDQTANVATRLNKSLVTVNFTVVPVPYTDRYEIVLEQTFETHVPLPVLVLTPTYTSYSDVTPGFQETLIVTAKNEGLIQMENFTMKGSSSDVASFTPLITYVPVILPQQSIEIPFTVTYTGTNANSGQGLGSAMKDCIPNPLETIGKLPELVAGLNAIANAEGRCIKDASLVYLAGAVAIGMSMYNDLTGILDVPGTVATYIGCVIGTLIASSDPGSGGSYTGASSTQGFEPADASCFAAGTEVLLADGRMKNIEQIVAGDQLKSGVGSNCVVTVSGFYQTDANVCRVITFGDKSLIATEEHLVWVERRGWITAGAVRPGDWFLTSDGGRAQVVSNQRVSGARKVYTLKVEGDVAFYANGVLVHDLCGAQAPPPRLRLGDNGPVSSQNKRVNPSK